MELKITKEKVIEAASKCSTAEATLKVLFPEVFVDTTGFESLRKVIEEHINMGEQFSYDLYKKIPGAYSRDKALWVVELIKQNMRK